MLSNTLSSIEKILCQQMDNKDLIPNILNFFRDFKKGYWLYPGILKRKFSLDLTDVYKILSEMERQGILQMCYELVCSSCQRSVGTAKLFNELPDTFTCEMCERELPTLENTFIIYKVLKDD